MNDAVRGFVVLAAAVAWLLATRLTIRYGVEAIRTGRRRHIAHHTALVWVSVTANAALAIWAVQETLGDNLPLGGKEPLRLVAQLAVVFALVPLLRLRKNDRQGEQA